eukprot:s145_g23.t1
MSFAFWPAAETVERFNQHVLRCGTSPPRRIGVWDSRYATHDIARRKIQALLADKDSARVLLCFRDPVRYVVSHFNRLSPESPGGSSLLAVVQGTDVDPDPFGLRLWKGNYTLLARKLAAAVGWERLILQPFDLLPTKTCMLPSLGTISIPEVVGVLQLLARIMGRFLFFVLCHQVVAAWAERLSCPYYQASGCILDQLEKVCEGEAAEMMAPNALENVWMCCCPRPYVSCSSNESDKTCVKALAGEIKSSGGELSIKGLMNVREKLLGSSERCSSFERPTQEAKCGKWPKEMPKVMCEMLTWQWEELGDGNDAEFAQYDCPMIKENQASDGELRKGHALNWDPRHREL